MFTATAQGAEPQARDDCVSAEQFLQSERLDVYRDLDKAGERGRRVRGDAVLSDASERSAERARTGRVASGSRARAPSNMPVLGREAALAGLEADAGAAGSVRKELVAQRDELERDIAQLRVDLSASSWTRSSSRSTRADPSLLDAIASPDTVDLVPSERAEELADEFVEPQAAAAELEADWNTRVEPTSAMAQLEQARAELAWPSRRSPSRTCRRRRRRARSGPRGGARRRTQGVRTINRNSACSTTCARRSKPSSIESASRRGALM